MTKTKKNIIQLDHSLLIRNSLENGEASKFDDDDDDEKFIDAIDESDKEENIEANDDSQEKKNNSWIHKKNIIFKKHDKYDYHERNPLYSGADKTLTYELLLYSKHYHPTVVVYANKLMNVI